MTDPLPFDRLEAGLQAAEDALQEGRFTEALQVFSQLLERALERQLQLQGEFRAADLMVCERVAELAALFGLEAAAEDILQAMAFICRNAGNPLAADHADLKRAELQVSAGRPDDAFMTLEGMERRIGALGDIDITTEGLMQWEAALPWKSDPQDRIAMLTRLHAVLAQVLLGVGRHADALCMIARGTFWAQGERAPDLARRALPLLRVLSARALLERGDLDNAQAAIALLRATVWLPRDAAAHVQVLLLAARLDMLRGLFGTATTHLRTAIDVCAKGRFDRAHAIAALNLAHALVLLNQVEEALRLSEDAGARAAALGDAALADRAAAIRTMALARRTSAAEALMLGLSLTEVFRGSTQRVASFEASPQSLAPTSRRDSFLSFFEDRAVQFHWELARQPRDAEHTLAQLRREVAHSDSRLLPPRLALMSGLLQAVRGDHAAAAAHFGEALDAFHGLGLVPEQWQAMHLRARSLARCGQAPAAAVLAGDADVLLGALSGSLPGAERAIYLLNKSTVEEEFVLAQLEELARDDERMRAGSAIARWRARLRIAKRLDALLAHLDQFRAGLADRQLHTGNGALERAARVTGLGLPKRLLGVPRDRAILSFVVLPDRLLVVWNYFMGIGFAVTPVSRIEARERVRMWHEYVLGEADGPGSSEMQEPQEDMQARQAIGMQLVDRLSAMLQLDQIVHALPERVTRLSIAPDDVLHGVPFSALRHEGSHLVERFAVTQTFDSLPPRRARGKMSGDALVAGVGHHPQASPLAHVAGECVSVAQWLVARGVTACTLMEREATPSEIARLLRTSSIAHLACHGVFDPEMPDQSGILLGGDPASSRLTLRTLASHSLKNCVHVTLSSCWSADNFILPGRWVISLPETLSRAGAQSVLGCLWPVADVVASPFMMCFYESLKHLPRDMALQKVQREFLQLRHGAWFSSVFLGGLQPFGFALPPRFSMNSGGEGHTGLHRVAASGSQARAGHCSATTAPGTRT